MAKFDQLRRAALALPDVEEGLHRGGPAFRVGGKAFAMWWLEGGRTIMKLRPAHQHLLFEVRPEAFQPCSVGVGVWSLVQLDEIDEAELEELVVEAWSTVNPKRRSREVEALRLADRREG